MNSNAEFYTVESICGAMSLRKPQRKSLEILEDILSDITPSKTIDKVEATRKIHAKYPIYTDFERDFMSLTFALATGVGKTRLMGAFIAYLYSQKGIKNFFIVAPGTTIYNKLRSDFGDASSPKYVFKGLSCFEEAPMIITDENYKNRLSNGHDINIFIFNIGKFDKENAQLKRLNEVLGDSFYAMVSNLDDLVVIMDESHHYRADSGMRAINELKPVLGLELTATPIVTSTQEPFKNVVYEYPLKQSIADGYTRSVFALTRSGIDFHRLGDMAMDIQMLDDGIKNHRLVKNALERYARQNNKPVVKPFMLVVCKDTAHANAVEQYIKSDDFCNGEYRQKTIIVTSKQGKVESDANQMLLLDVEKSSNPVEIVIHVNMLKEGWDVNNLYTIVPLRTAASKVLREQMVGRGLRLPYGERTGNQKVDSVVLTAHDKFNEILKESEEGDSIFNKGCVIEASEWLKDEKPVQTIIEMETPDEARDRAYTETQLPRTEDNTKVIDFVNSKFTEAVEDAIQEENNTPDAKEAAKKVKARLVKKIEEHKDYAETYKENKEPFETWLEKEAERKARKVIAEFIPIPVISMRRSKEDVFEYVDFDADLSVFTEEPIKNEAFMQNISSKGEERIYLKEYGSINLGIVNPKKPIIEGIRAKSDIDYELCAGLLHKVTEQVCAHYKAKYGDDGLKNIVAMNIGKIVNCIYNQLQNHFVCKQKGEIIPQITDVRTKNIPMDFSYKTRSNLYGNFEGNIKSVSFEGMKKSVFKSHVRFDSEPEREFARLLESEPVVKRWLRPATKEFEFSATRKGDYDPDFVVLTDDMIYMVEVKNHEKMQDEDVLIKKDKAVEYCSLATEWSERNGYRPWRYVLIPDNVINRAASFDRLVMEYLCE